MSERLERYREMRDFSITPEPRGKSGVAKKKKLRYYIQRHAATRLHYDFRLELGGVLRSWAVPKGPSFDPADKRLAVQTEDHPLDYGEFEGVIPEKQYGAGEVLLWDRGVWTPQDPDPREALRKGRLHFRLDGEKLHGSWTLARMKNGSEWLLIKRRDEDARSGFDVTRERPESVKRAPRRARRAEKSELPQFIAPQLATLVTEPPRLGNWVYEVKHDGYRMLARIAGSARAPRARVEVRLFTRSGRDWTSKLPHLAGALQKLRLKDTWLDGEIVVPGPDGRSSFQRLQNAFEAGRDTGIVYYAFDAPFLSGQNLQRLPLVERKKRLQKALKASEQVRLSEHLEGDAQAVLAQACRLGLEGLIGKEAGAVYMPGRSKSWIKLKCRQRQDFVIGGYTAPGGSRQGFGALLVGYYDAQQKLQYAGKVGTGFDEALLQSMTRRLAALRKPEPPFENSPKEKGVHWVRPVLVAEVAYAERTHEGILRQASFMGLREDLPSKSVHEEKAVAPPVKDTAADTVLGVKISSPDRVIWPKLGIRKVELARYIETVGDWLLPHVKDRPLSLVRCPDGAEGQCFYQRHLLMARSPGKLQTVRREGSSKGAYIYAASLDAVVGAVQNGAIEFHTWGATVPDVQHPDRITMDLDPDEALPWGTLVEGTLLLKTLMDGLQLKTFLKTTGGKGLHVVAPIRPGLGWDEVKDFTLHIALMLARARPDLFTAKISRQRRPNRIFVDYLRNSETASAVAAFSPRARPAAGVSVPLSWDELDANDDLRTRFDVKNVPERLARLGQDPWADYARTRQSITAKMRKALGSGK